MSTHETHNNETHEKETPTTSELLDLLSNRFRSGETPRTLDELHELEDGINHEGEERGFSRSRSYVDGDGGLIMIARKKDDLQRGYERAAASETCRILFDDKILEVTIPPEWQHEELNFASDDIRRDNIYDVTKVDIDTLPDDMKLLVDKFGPKLTREVSIMNPDPRNPNSIAGVAVGLDEIGVNIERQNAEITRATEEAYGIENDAKAAAGLVRKKLFRSAQKLEKLRENAYREAIASGNAANRGAPNHAVIDSNEPYHAVIDPKVARSKYLELYDEEKRGRNI